jgi:transposase
MKRLRIQLTEIEQQIVVTERESYPDPCVRRKLWVLWLLHCGTTREKAAEIVGVARSTVERYVADFRKGGLDGLRKRTPRYKPISELAAHTDIIRQSLERQPARTIAEACQRVAELTGVIRKPTQVRRFLKGLGLKWQRVRAIPVPPKKTWRNTLPIKPPFTMKN